MTTTANGHRALTPQAIRELPAMVDAPTVARALNISDQHVHNLYRRGQLPFAAHKLGRRLLVRRVDLSAYLGINEDTTDDRRIVDVTEAEDYRAACEVADNYPFRQLIFAAMIAADPEQLEPLELAFPEMYRTVDALHSMNGGEG
ncbi:Helix-turn-helix domain-containing protein [Haloechinothrix alba]|uniref:Helix-turn-helix domain-containing protein n=1 Tax=Haloechinothrix alba TaxID=664784 RepID=A0A238WCZ4_9PSEU|nr:helix-turn-helix domain-containing protein [Haloechinothrix alba]SNR44455.1 Helix-turn-helix domain-containing protein [Haloechinothrix alba]